MRIAFFGTSLVSSYRNGAATYCRGLLHALAERGHHITFHEPDLPEREAYRDIPDPDWARVEVYSPDRAGVTMAIEHARAADVVIKASGVGVFDSLLDASLPGLRRPGLTVIYWDMEPVVTLERVQAEVNDPLRILLPLYDMVMTRGGGRPVVASYLKLGARTCVPVYNAVDPRTHHPAPPDDAYAADAVFLGNRLPDRDERVAAFLLRTAEGLPHRRFLIAGAGWEAVRLPANVVALGHVPTPRHNVLHCSARAVIAIARDAMARHGLSPSSRLFEAAGAGACIISDDWTGLESFLEPGREVLVAGDGDDVIAHLEELTPAKAARIGDGARQRVLGMHTFAHRSALVEAVLLGSRAQPLEVRI